MTNDNPLIHQVKCWSCQKNIDNTDGYCRYCGNGQGSCVRYYYKPWGIIVLTILGLGPLTIYHVWRSPVISDMGKILLSLAVLAITGYFFYLAYSTWVAATSVLASV
ncbi:MAG: hypothetical protein NTW04_03015 [Elusimicrobia bacterium]|nr:hypothetical protein [Elusimicrobiota bacterium]